MTTRLDATSCSSSTCFAASIAPDADELRTKREDITRRVKEAAGEWNALREEPPSNDNCDRRYEFDEMIDIIGKDMEQWRAEALELADAFDEEEARMKSKKRILNFVRRQKTILQPVRILYDPDNENHLPLVPFPRLAEGQFPGIDTAPSSRRTSQAENAPENAPPSGVDPSKLTAQLLRQHQDQQDQGLQPTSLQPDNQGATGGDPDPTEKSPTRQQQGQTGKKRHNLRSGATLSAAEKITKGLRSMLTPTRPESRKRGVPVSAGEGGKPEKKVIKDNGKGPLPMDALGEEENRKTEPDEVRIVDEVAPQIVGSAGRGAMEPVSGANLALPKKQEEPIDEADEAKKEEIRKVEKQVEEISGRAGEMAKKVEETEKETEETRKRKEEEEKREQEDKQKAEREENERRKGEEKERREKEDRKLKREEEKQGDERRESELKREREEGEERERKKREKEAKKRKVQANKAADERLDRLKKELQSKKQEEESMEQRTRKAKEEKARTEDSIAKIISDREGRRFIRVTPKNSKKHCIEKPLSHSSPVQQVSPGHERGRERRRSGGDENNGRKGRRTGGTRSKSKARERLSRGRWEEERRRQELEARSCKCKETCSANSGEEEEKDEETSDAGASPEVRRGPEEGEEGKREREEKFFDEAGIGRKGREIAREAENRREKERFQPRAEMTSQPVDATSGRMGAATSNANEIDGEWVPRPMTDSDVRREKLARERARENRPKTEDEKIVIEDGKDYVTFKNRFKTATNLDGLSDEDKLAELLEWTKGPTRRMIEAHVGSDDPKNALTTCWSQLDQMFRAQVLTPLQRLSNTFKKGQLNQKLTASHYDVLADLQVIYSTAKRSKCDDEFDKVDIIREVVARKMECYRQKFWEEEAKARKESGEEKVYFQSVIDFLANQSEIAALMGTVEGQKQTVNVNATLVAEGPQTWSQTVRDSPKKPQGPLPIREVCAECGKNHSTKLCRILINLPEEKVLPRIRELGLCFKCAEKGHIARDCKVKPSCANCGNNHLTILHKVKAKKNLIASQAFKQRSEGSGKSQEPGAAIEPSQPGLLKPPAINGAIR